MAGFKLPPISTLAGTTIGNYIKVLQKGKIDRKYYLMVVLTFLIVFIATPFHLWEWIRFQFISKAKEVKPPLFILGHWRSGTTFLHNLLCQDPDAGYLTTFHSLFPNNLGSKAVFKTFMKLNMPEKRPSDNVKLNVNFPQEDDFALGNLCDLSYYNFFYFPGKYNKFYKEAVGMQAEEIRIRRWERAYKKLIDLALYNTSGKRAIIKNPVNTGRISAVLKLFPDARFIYIYRNPYTVFLSTQKFFRALCPTLWFQEVDSNFLDDLIFDVFRRLLEDYEKQKGLIPKENLKEVQFESLERNPIAILEDIYKELLEEDFERCRDSTQSYLSELGDYKKNEYQIERKYYDRIQKEWGFFLEAKGYDLPDNIKITD